MGKEINEYKLNLSFNERAKCIGALKGVPVMPEMKTRLFLEITEQAVCSCGWKGCKHQAEIEQDDLNHSNRLKTTGVASLGAGTEAEGHVQSTVAKSVSHYGKYTEGLLAGEIAREKTLSWKDEDGKTHKLKINTTVKQKIVRPKRN